MPIKAPAGSAVAFCGWCCGYGTKSTPKSAPTGSDKVWAIYRHPSSRKVYTIYGKYRSGTLEGLRHGVYSKGKILTDAAFKTLIDTKVRGGYRCGNAKARDFAAQLRRAGFAVARSAKAAASPRTTPAKKLSGRKKMVTDPIGHGFHMRDILQGRVNKGRKTTLKVSGDSLGMPNAEKTNLATIKAHAKKMGYRKVLVVNVGEGNEEHKL